MPRLNILTGKEQVEFDYPPTLTVEARSVCFAIDDALDAQIKKWFCRKNNTDQLNFAK